MNFVLDHWSSILANIVAILGAFYGLVMALQAAFAFVGMFWAPAKRAVAFLAVIGTDVKQLKDKLPGGGGGVAGVLLFLASSHIAALTLLVGCAGLSQLTTADKAALAGFSAQIASCNAGPDPVGCKASAKAAFDAEMNAKFDGGFGR